MLWSGGEQDAHTHTQTHFSDSWLAEWRHLCWTHPAGPNQHGCHIKGGWWLRQLCLCVCVFRERESPEGWHHQLSALGCVSVGGQSCCPKASLLTTLELCDATPPSIFFVAFLFCLSIYLLIYLRIHAASAGSLSRLCACWSLTGVSWSKQKGSQHQFT